MNGDSGDSFPGTSEVTSFNFNGWYDRNVFGFAYVDETEGGDARFLLSGSSYKLDNPQISISDIRGRSAKATWTSVKYAKSYNVTLMQNGKALESLSTEGNEIEFDGLEPQTEYTAVVQAALADYVSDSVKVNFTTSELNFDERKVNAKAPLASPTTPSPPAGMPSRTLSSMTSRSTSVLWTVRPTTPSASTRA